MVRTGTVRIFTRSADPSYNLEPSDSAAAADLHSPELTAHGQRAMTSEMSCATRAHRKRPALPQRRAVDCPAAAGNLNGAAPEHEIGLGSGF